MRRYFWLDIKQLNDIYRYKRKEYSHTAVNKFNAIPDSLCGVYFIGNVSPAKMDFRWFCLGDCMAILSSLVTPKQSSGYSGSYRMTLARTCQRNVAKDLLSGDGKSRMENCDRM
ncbi:Glycosyl hydrolase family 100 [Cynara cardunculus var. scolymus]|uniref:Glycosyl hydrolase family 100 n=1 Tax=Cynara cardunculus var. scolymus TaxID=59895 RepID=A0A103YEU4_CYNCS|nr:Glycosyl hydrolase family 100 [Cynara cardunculus var. scolymus]